MRKGDQTVTGEGHGRLRTMRCPIMNSARLDTRRAGPFAVILAMFVVAACAVDGRHDLHLTGGVWKLSRVAIAASASATDVPHDEQWRYTVEFEPDAEIAVGLQCGEMAVFPTGTYTAASSPGSMTITLEPSSSLACPQDPLAGAFLEKLRTVTSFEVGGGDDVVSKCSNNPDEIPYPIESGMLGMCWTEGTEPYLLLTQSDGGTMTFVHLPGF